MKKISTIAYKIIYKEFVKKVWNTELTDSQKTRLQGINYNIWQVKDVGLDGTNFYTRIFENLSIARGRFSKNISTINSSGSSKISMNEEVLARMLEYIGISIPENIPKRLRKDEIQIANILYDEFLLKYEIDEITNDNTKNSNTQKNKIDYKTNSDEENQLDINSSEQEENISMNINIMKLVNDFYQSISASKYEKAWGMLAETFKKRVWKNKFEDFEIGYTYVLSVNKVHIWDVNVEDTNANCKVYYEDVVDTFTSMELGNIDKLTLGDLDEFSIRLKKLQENATKVPFENFDKLEIIKFFEPAVSEYIWYKCGKKPDAISSLLNARAALPISRLYNISCVKEDDSWLIKAITPIRTSLYR